jgi:hypothetical protein
MPELPLPLMGAQDGHSPLLYGAVRVGRAPALMVKFWVFSQTSSSLAPQHPHRRRRLADLFQAATPKKARNGKSFESHQRAPAHACQL